MSGIDAEKEFYRLRQKFGKERRKVVQSQARSGAGANHVPYKSSWELYNDLMFLVDHIQPRRTTSNYKRPSSLQASQLATSTLTYSSISTPSLISDESRELWNNDLYDSLAGSESTTTTTTKDERPSSASELVVSFSDAFTSTKSASSKASTNILKASVSAITPEKQTPLPHIKKRKRKTAYDVDTIMLESSKNICSLASTLETALKDSKPATSQLLAIDGCTPAIQGMMSSIAFGISKVSKEHQMKCLIEILSCIDTFINK